MGVLIKRQILELAKDKKVNLLGENFKTENVKGCSYDLRIGTIFRNDQIITKLDGDNSNLVNLLPSEIITILTYEEVNLPTTICGTVFSINRNSSSGLLILNPGHIDPGYKGPISICAINLSNETKPLYIGKEIFTIYFHELTAATEPIDNRFTDRRLYEKTLYDERFKKLSPSFFDLMKIDKYKPHLVELIKEIQNENRREWWEKFWNNIGLYITIITGIIAIIVYLSSQDRKTVEKLQKENQFIKDTLEIRKLDNSKDKEKLLQLTDTILYLKAKSKKHGN
jgi:deoxycytidine triphosphate deaminase